jgi:fermentation-respiration switch protein FrsA (DUF1100 family)
MVQRQDVEFTTDDGITLRAWLFVPDGAGPFPAVTMAHGYAGVRDHGIEPFARAFAEDGFVVLLHDHRAFGASDGIPRQDVDPWRQISDWRYAISFLEQRPEVDPGRIGLWGTSYAGGHAIVLGATDRRLRCIVAQVPTISGYEQGLRRVPPDAVAALEEGFAQDDRNILAGQPPGRQAIVSADPGVQASYRGQAAIDFYLQKIPEGVWENSVTVRSARAARMYEPGAWIARVSPTPLLLIVALSDTITLTDLELGAYERARQPKKLVTIPGGHFDPYTTRFSESSSAARAWFAEHLR